MNRLVYADSARSGKLLKPTRALHTAEVAGSKPASPTKKILQIDAKPITCKFALELPCSNVAGLMPASTLLNDSNACRVGKKPLVGPHATGYTSRRKTKAAAPNTTATVPKRREPLT